MLRRLGTVLLTVFIAYAIAAYLYYIVFLFQSP